MSTSLAEQERTPTLTLCCSFCGARQHEVKRLVIGPSCVAICNDCVGNCAEIVADGRRQQLLRETDSPDPYAFWGIAI